MGWYRIVSPEAIPDLAGVRPRLAFGVNSDRPPSLLRTLLVLGRVSNLPTVWTNVAVGWFLSGGGWTGELGWTVLGMSLLYIAGMTLNDAYDAAWDRLHAASRPIPSGRIGRGAVWAVGIGEMAAGTAILLGATTVHPLLVVGLVAAILLYNWLHKRWTGSVLVMGLCRALVYVGAGSAVAMHTQSLEVPTTVFVLAAGVVLYIAGLTLAARQEHLDTPLALRLLPRLMLMLPVIFPLVASRPTTLDGAAIVLLVAGVLGTGAWLTAIRRALAERVPKGIAFAIAGIALYDAAAVVFADWRAAIACLAAFALTLGLQRVVPAT